MIPVSLDRRKVLASLFVYLLGAPSNCNDITEWYNRYRIRDNNDNIVGITR